MKVEVDKIEGYNRRKIDLYIDKTNRSENLYLLYPGYNYGYNHPFYYYLTQLLSENNQDFIFFDFNWCKLNESEPDIENPKKVIDDEIKSSLNYKLIEDYKNYIVIGKSLGTTSIEIIKKMKSLDEKVLKYVWLTPFKNTENLLNLNLNKDYIYVGTNDTFYNEEIYYKLDKITNIRRLIDLDHGFNVENDSLESITELKKILVILKNDIF